MNDFWAPSPLPPPNILFWFRLNTIFGNKKRFLNLIFFTIYMLDFFHMIIVAVLENVKGFRLFNIVRQTVGLLLSQKLRLQSILAVSSFIYILK